MDAEKFLAEFSHIANSPAGVARLRELVLQLAISGRLIERGTAETSVTESLMRAAIQRQQYEETLGLRAARPHPPVETIPYSIPAHWQWVRLEEVSLYVQRGKGPKYAEHGSVSVVSQKCIQWKGFDPQQKRFVADSSIIGYGSERFLRDGDLLWNSTGTGTVGRGAIYPGDLEERCVADSHVTVIRLSEAATPRYIWCVIASPWVQARIHPTHTDSLVSGTTQQVELSTGNVRALPIPCPPVEEQFRIIAKVDELMALCGRLEAQQHERRKLQKAVRESTLQAVAEAQSPHELQDSWQRLHTNFGRLFSKPEDVGHLRTLVLELAANGNLSEPQNGDSDFHELLEQAQAEQSTECSSRELREIGALPEVIFENGRLRAALGRVTKLISGQHLSPEEYNSRQMGIPYITGPAEFENRRPSPSKWTTERRSVARAGDVLITVKGSGVGKTAICDLDELAISRQLMAIRALGGIDRDYLWICIESAERSFQEQKFGIAIPGIGREEVLRLNILVPAVEEQRRIVARVSDLLRFCDEIEVQLRNASRLAERFATSAITAVTGITIEQEDEALVKAPQTELIAPLTLGTPPDVETNAPLANLLARHNGEMSARDLWQRFGGEIDAFYAQLKTEVSRGWIAEPAIAKVREKLTEPTEV